MDRNDKKIKKRMGRNEMERRHLLERKINGKAST